MELFFLKEEEKKEKRKKLAGGHQLRTIKLHGQGLILHLLLPVLNHDNVITSL